VDTLDGSHFRHLKQVEKKIGRPLLEASWKSIPSADFILMLGCKTDSSQPLIISLIQKTALENGTETAMIGSQGNLLPYAGYSIHAEKGDEALLIKALKKSVNGLIQKSMKNQKSQADPTLRSLSALGLDHADIRAFSGAAKAFAGAKAPIIIAGDNLIHTDDPAPLLLASELAMMKGMLAGGRWRLIIQKANGNSPAAWKLGLSSQQEMKKHPKWAGGLILLGGENKIGSLYRTELNHLDFLAVISPIFPQDLPESACVLLPKPLWMEEDGTYTSLDGTEVGYKKSVTNAPDGIRSTWKILSGLADRLGFDLTYKKWNDLKKAATRCIKDKEKHPVDKGKQRSSQAR
jgi:NADH dehydrogenase/NADH:ubiquinone oxidoreductase subunit G